MQDEVKQKKLLFYSSAYLTNINYLFVIVLLLTNLEFDKDPYITIMIWGIPAFISTLFSIVIIRNNLEKNQSRDQGLIRIAIAHVPSVLGVLGAIMYLFVY